MQSGNKQPTMLLWYVAAVLITAWGSAAALDSGPADPLLMYGAGRQALADDELQLMLGTRDTGGGGVEQLPHSSLWGHKYVAGGAGEGNQFLKPSGTIPNREQVKTDAMLPAYCEPPNPCPPGMTAEDGCSEEFENTAEFSRQHQAQQQCMCDEEHMFSCPHNQRKLTSDRDNAQATFADVLEQFLQKQNIVDQHKEVRAKKFHETKRHEMTKRSVGGHHQHQQQHQQVYYNPYMAGDKRVHIVAKKG